MAAPALPELTAAALARCPSQPARPPGAPRRAAPPSAAAPFAADTASQARLALEAARADAAAAWGLGERPLREALASRGGRPAPRRELDLALVPPFGAFGAERALGRAASGRLLGAGAGLELLRLERREAPEEDEQQLKRARRSQLRREREAASAEPSEAEAARHRRGADALRGAPREADEHHPDEECERDDRSRTLAAALAKQAMQHERELEELRRAVRKETEQQLTEKFAEQVSQFHRCLARLQSLALDLQQQTAQHAAELEAACAHGAPAPAPAPSCAERPAPPAVPEPEPAAPAPAPALQPSAGSFAEVAGAVEGALASARANTRRAISARRPAAELPLGGRRVSVFAVRQVHEHCKLLQVQVLGRLSAESRCLQHLALRSWAEARSSARAVRARRQHLSSQCAMVQKSERMQDLAAVRSVLSAWANLCVETRCKAAYERRLERENAIWVAERRDLEAAACRQVAALGERLQSQAHRAALVHVRNRLESALFWWTAVIREARREASYRHQLLIAAADRDAELFRVRADGGRTANELRKQRRAHGVAAIHASLDRRLQAVVHAWSAASRDAQREAVYQRQLDIAAAEAAAGCAVLRMEGRRSALELRLQRRAQALRWLEATSRHWRHAVLAAWALAAAARPAPPPGPPPGEPPEGAPEEAAPEGAAPEEAAPEGPAAPGGPGPAP